MEINKVKLKWHNFLCQKRISDMVPYIDLIPKRFDIDKFEQSNKIEVESNVHWRVTELPNWIELSPQLGFKGINQSITFQANDNKGRFRLGEIVYEGEDFPIKEKLQVRQVGKEVFVKLEENLTINLKDFLSELKFKGESNAQKIYYNLGVGDLNVSLPSNYIINSNIIVENNELIPGDLGEFDSYRFEILVKFIEPLVHQYRYIDIIADNTVINRIKITVQDMNYSIEYSKEYN